MSMAFSPYHLAMMFKLLTLLLIGCAYAAPAENVAGSKTAAVAPKEASTDLNTDASSYFNYNDRYSDYGSRSYPSAYGASGYGAGVSGYGVGGYGSVDDRYGVGGYDGGYSGGNGGYGYDRGYGGSNGNGAYGGYSGGYGGYGATNGGYGGYGGSGGNGGLNSYYGYNNPSYQGYGYTGHGYYNKQPGYGNIYSSGITPSLVTGYRGYSRK